MRIQTINRKNWHLIEKVNAAGRGLVTDFLVGLGANKQREATRMIALMDRVAANGPRQGTAKCHQIKGDIWELIHGSLRVLFAHDGHRLIICTSGFIKKSQKTPKQEIKRAERILNEYRQASIDEKLEWVNHDQENEQ
ncbi:MAG: type II toxin-antitoxin system RelE/ParE family toxin [Gammaproteobacteria bacterium]|nr:type II toxin-antitoxin system RelE/ParE family toxin [Gammaproteobacteria bacterium]